MADPGFLTVAGDDYAQTTDKAQLDVTGDLDLAILVEPANGWNEQGASQALAAKRTNASFFERAWDFYYFNQGGGNNVLRFEWKDGGGSEHTTTSTATLGSVASGDHMWLRVTLDVDDGSSQHVVTFYYSNDPIDTPIGSVSWTQLGSPVVVAGTTSIANSPHNLRVGLANASAYDGFNGKVYGFWMRNGIGGTLVAAPDWRTSDQDWANPPTADGVGNDWTLEGDAAWTPPVGEHFVQVGQAAEAENALPITPVISREVAVGQASETETAQVITPLISRVVQVGQASESETANQIVPLTSRVVAVGPASEAETANEIRPVINRVVMVGTATEIELGQFINPVKPINVAVGTAIERELARIMIPQVGEPFLPDVACDLHSLQVECAVSSLLVECEVT